HFLWNAPFWQPNSADGLEWTEVGTYIVKGLPALLLVGVLYWLAHRREVSWFCEVLDGRTDDVTAGELQALLTLRGRRAARVRARNVCGPTAGRAVRELQRSQVRLACALAQGTRDHDIEALRSSIRQARDHVRSE